MEFRDCAVAAAGDNSWKYTHGISGANYICKWIYPTTRFPDLLMPVEQAKRARTGNRGGPSAGFLPAPPGPPDARKRVRAPVPLAVAGAKD